MPSDAKTWRMSSGFIKALQLVHVFPVIIMMVAPASESASRKAGCKAFSLECMLSWHHRSNVGLLTHQSERSLRVSNLHVARGDWVCWGSEGVAVVPRTVFVYGNK